jgi:undecaprenyl phosphate-alpha-L-ara4FN deformylase
VAGTVPDDEYNQYLIDQMDSDRDEVLTIHAEAEGLSKAALFEDFLDRMARIDRRVVPLGTLIDSAKTLPVASLEASDLPGREGWVATVSGRPPENSGGPTSASFRL